MKALLSAAALALAVSLAAPAVAAQEQPAVQEGEPREIEVTILGMSCPFCAYGVEQKLRRLEGVTDLTVELSTGLATLTLEDDADISNEVLIRTVEDAGFEVAKIERNFDSEFPDFDRNASG